MAKAPGAYTLWQRGGFDPSDPIWPNRDRFVLSAGHASMLLCALLQLARWGPVAAGCCDPEGLGQHDRLWDVVAVTGFSRLIGGWMVPSRNQGGPIGFHRDRFVSSADRTMWQESLTVAADWAGAKHRCG